MRRYAWAGGLFLGFALLASPVRAVIKDLTPLNAVLKESTFILVARVDVLDADKLTLILTADEHLKGKAPFARLPVNLKSTEKGADKEIPVLTKRLAPKLPVLLFVNDLGDGDYRLFAYTNGTWSMFRGVTPKGADAPRWVFVNLEPYLRRTFKGTTAEMKQTIVDGLSGKKAPPPPNENEKPGVGPEATAEQPKEEEASFSRERSASANRPTITAGPPFGVIPSVLVGGPLAVLSMLFPTWFGGWKRWLALITGVCSASTVVFVYWLWGGRFYGTIFGNDLAQWLLVTLVTLLAAVWAWRRHVDRVHNDEAPAVPSRAELIILSVVSVIGVGAIVFCKLTGDKLTSPAWLSVLAICVGAWVATLYVVWMRFGSAEAAGAGAAAAASLAALSAVSSNGAGSVGYTTAGTGTAVAEKVAVAAPPVPFVPPPRKTAALATEAVMLTAMALASVGMTFAVQTSRGGRLAGAEATSIEEALDGLPVRKGKQVWAFRPGDSGSLGSSPLIAGDRVYVGGTVGAAFKSGVVWCLDLKTGTEVWNTKKTIKRMKNISISSPVLADGRLYIGEGFHQDVNCKVYCINAETGEEVWSFPTGSHTESSPYVAGGKVYIGAGDDGLYCLDAATGKEVWHYNGLHIDASPVVAGGRVYVGAGEGDVYKETAVVGLDAATGKEEWKKKLDLPAWGSPVVVGDLVYFGTGNGHFNESDAKPAGALLCVRAKDGEKVWSHDLKDGILCRPTADRSRIYVGARDNHFYCLERKTGKVVWERDLGSPIVTAAVLARVPELGVTTAVYVTASDGQVYCLGPNTGRVYWSADLSDDGKSPLTLWSSPALVSRRDNSGETRQLVFGASVGPEGTQSPAVFCYEDRVEADPADEPVESRP